MNSVEKWLGEENKLGIDIWNKKYRYDGETFSDWLDRMCGGNAEIRKLILDQKFLFGGRILASRGLQNKGRKITFSNCYVIAPPEDNIESIFDCAKKLARTYSYGGGCGLDISKLAPSGAKINNAAKETTGAVSFMNLYSMVTELIGQFGRRGALMLSMDCTHPDIENFIDIKNDLTKVTKANISVKISDYFMNCLLTGKPWKLHFSRPETNELVEREVEPAQIWKKLCHNNWNMAEPGILFWDRIKNWNLLSEDESFEYAGVNPCAEEPLPAGGSCLLGSINLSKFVKNPFGIRAQFDFKAFGDTVKKAVVALNEVLDEGLELHPLQEQRDSVRDWRQIGLGVMGLADMLIMLGIKYGSDDAVNIVNKIGYSMINSAVAQSAMLAKEFGAYPQYKKDAVAASPFFIENISDEVKELVSEHGIRNSQLLTCAPTGTLSTMLGISGGIEPIFARSYQRKTESLHGEDVFYTIYTPIVKQYMDINNLESEDELPDFITTSMELNYNERLNMQSAAQTFIDASISSTVNVPNDFTEEDVKELYINAWKLGLKGVTIYRDGCLRSGILTTSSEVKDEKTYKLDYIQPLSRSDFGETHGTTNKFLNACGSFYLTINRDGENNIVETFINTSKTGTCESNIAGLNRMISLALRTGTKVDEIVDQLKGIKCAACTVVKSKGEKKLSGMSCADIIAKALHDEYYRNSSEKKVSDDKPKASNVCPECKTVLHLSEGCATCHNCGYSKCS